MKKILLTLLLIGLFVSTAHAFNPLVVCGGGVAAESCTLCTGGKIFVAYFEDASGDVTLGSPCGCSAGDKVGAANDSCTITGGYLYSADGQKYFAWDVSSDDIVDDTDGSFLIELEIETFVNYTEPFSVYVDSNNMLRLRLVTGDEINLTHEGDNTSSSVSTSGTDTLVVSTRYFIVGRWTTSDVDPNLFLAVYASNDDLIDDASTNTNLTPFSVQPSTDDFIVGNRPAEEGSVKIYKIIVWDTYDGAPSSGFSTE